MFDNDSYNAIVSVANNYNIEPAKLLAVTQVESGGTPFWNINGRKMPVIRFEGHYFYRLLSNDQRAKAVKQGLASPVAGAIKNPRDATARYELLNRARAINRDAANMSVSWGVGQVMGENWKALGYASVDQLVQSATSSINGQVELMVKFIIKNNLLDELQSKNWAAFAKRYNGPSYKTNKYDVQLAAAYKKFAGAKTRGEVVAVETKTLQKQLKKVGAYDGKIDGEFGPKTETAVKTFQAANGLEADGEVGSITSSNLVDATAKIDSDNHDALVPKIAAAAGAGLPIGSQILSHGPAIMDGINKANESTSSVSSLLSNIGYSGIIATVVLSIVAAVTLYFVLKKK